MSKTSSIDDTERFSQAFEAAKSPAFPRLVSLLAESNKPGIDPVLRNAYKAAALHRLTNGGLFLNEALIVTGLTP